jgi:hypothetical protein
MLQQAWVASGGSTATPTAGWTATTAGGSSLAGPGPALATGTRAPAAAGSGPVTLPPAYTGPEQAYGELCADTSNPPDPAAYPAIAKAVAARSGGFGLWWTWADEPCARWPGNGARDRYTGPWNRPTANPILVFGNTGDVAVNYQDSVATARDLADARLLTIDQFGHTEGLNPSTCATTYEVSYLTAGALPPAGTACQPDAPPFPG